MSAESSNIELSVVMPCLNEADTLAACISKAQKAFRENNIAGEIIVADNGSTDGSQDIATKSGARLVPVQARGYGNALMGGIAAARGKYVIMGDADDSYDYLEIPKFVARLREGNQLVQGCRLPAGGGRIIPGAMPFRLWFHTPIHDIYCGMRGFTKSHYESLGQRCTGMEFATEMIIKSSLYHTKMAEVPITLHPDGRKAHTPHLKTFRDGWRTLRYFLMSSPRWLFFLPGCLLILLGIAGYAVVLPRLTILGTHPDAHTLLFATMSILCGYQAILFAVFMKAFASDEGLLPPDPRLDRFLEAANLERGIVVAILVTLVGVCLLLSAVNVWRMTSFGQLNYSETMRLVIPGSMFVVLGVQTIFSSFFISILGMAKR